jgi:hypothetical protein
MAILNLQIDMKQRSNLYDPTPVRNILVKLRMFRIASSIWLVWCENRNMRMSSVYKKFKSGVYILSQYYDMISQFGLTPMLPVIISP